MTATMNSCVHDHSRWGPADRLGAGNHLTDETRLAAIRMVEKGTVYDLSHVIRMGAPAFAPTQPPYLMMMWQTSRDAIRRRRDLGATNDAGTNLERIEMTVHVGTHIDALGHASVGDRLYNGVSALEEVGDWGLRTTGIEHCPPIITRGVLLDLANLDGGPHLQPGRAIRAADLDAACNRIDVTLRAGDVVCLRTGWGRFFMKDNAKYLSGEPGIDLSGAEWLTARDVTAIGADTMAVEVMPGADPKTLMPVHQHCLAEQGVYLIENLALEQLAADKVGTFCFILLPTKFKGATGSPAMPVAMI